MLTASLLRFASQNEPLPGMIEFEKGNNMIPISETQSLSQKQKQAEPLLSDEFTDIVLTGVSTDEQVFHRYAIFQVSRIGINKN